MPSTHLLKLSLYTAILIAVLHVSAVFFFFYWSYWWFDIPLHFLGGLSIGFLAIWFYINYRSDKYKINSLNILLAGILGAFTIGALWETFEYVNGMTQNGIGSYKLDTIKDLVLDVMGGCAAYLYTSFIFLRNK